MPSLSIKNVPEELLAQLRARAMGHHRSLQGELLCILEEAMAPKALTLAQVRSRVKELGIKSADDSTTWIRELRDAR